MASVREFLAFLFLAACGSDIGVHYTKTTEITGEPGFKSGIAYEQAIDILFIVDESGSMYDDQARLSSYMPDIYDTLVGPNFTNLKWRVGITAADDTAPIYATVDYDDADADLKLLTLTSFLEGHYQEAGLDAAVQSIAWDSDFHRDEADLLLVYISDEAEQSSIDFNTYEQIMSSAKDYPFMVTESSIVFTGNTLLYNEACDMESAINLGTGYMNVSEIIIDLCETTNWERVLDIAKEHVPTLNESWPLDYVPAKPYEDHIEVYWDDTMSYDWYYDEGNNSVELTKIPDPGVFVSIVYVY